MTTIDRIMVTLLGGPSYLKAIRIALNKGNSAWPKMRKALDKLHRDGYIELAPSPPDSDPRIKQWYALSPAGRSYAVAIDNREKVAARGLDYKDLSSAEAVHGTLSLGVCAKWPRCTDIKDARPLAHGWTTGALKDKRCSVGGCKLKRLSRHNWSERADVRVIV